MHSFEVEFIKIIQSIRSPIWDEFFLWINLFDKTITYLVIVYLIYSLKNARTGIHLLWLLTIATITCLDLKDFLSQPRPYHLFPELKILGSVGYGFPSGATTSSSILLGFIFFVGPGEELFNRLYKTAAVALVLLVGLTRIYLGAHFPSDVLGGYLLGVSFLVGYKYAMPFLEKCVKSFSKYFLFFIQLIALIAVFMIHPKEYSAICGCYLLGGILAYFFLRQEESSKKKNMYLMIFFLFLGVFGLIFLFSLSKEANKEWVIVFLSLIIGIWFQGSKAVFKAVLPKKWKNRI